MPKTTGNIEYKACDTDINGERIDNVGSFSLLNGIAQGTDYTNRIGNKVKCKSVNINGQFVLGATPIECEVKLILFVDKQVNGSQPEITGAAGSATKRLLAATAGTGVPWTPLDLFNRDRYVVLKTKRIILRQLYSSATNLYTFKMFSKLNLQEVFEGTGATYQSISSGALYLGWISSIASGSTARPFIYANARVRYTDD